jgi:hypothetical protein
MPSSDLLALQGTGFDEFLFAAVGTEANGMTLSVVSVFARLGEDPWQAARRLAGLPKSEAIEMLARTIATMPASLWPLPAARPIAERLIASMPKKGAPAAKAQAGLLLTATSVLRTHYRVIAVVLVCLAGLVAYGTGALSTSADPRFDGGDVPSFSTPSR